MPEKRGRKPKVQELSLKDEPSKSESIDIVSTEKTEITSQGAGQNKQYLVYVNGHARWLTQSALDAAMRDSKYSQIVEFPEGSDYIPMNLRTNKKCTTCS